MTAAKMRAELLFDESCGVVLYRKAGWLLGQAFFRTFTVPDGGPVRWITQLAVSTAHRRHGIATMMLNSALFRRNSLFAAALVSSHPAAVRALELVAGARVSTAKISATRNVSIHAAPCRICAAPSLR
jgi:GNAT superfamily N-acetyltransferase